MKKTNILIIEPYCFLPAIYGGKKAIEQLYQNIGKMADITIVSVKSNDEAFVKNYKLIKLFNNSSFRYVNLLYYFKLKKIVIESKITHVIIEHPYMGWLGFLLQKFTSVKFIVRSQNIESIRFKTFGKWWWKVMWNYEKWVHMKADMNFFITKEDEDFAIENYHLSAQKCSVITFGINQQKLPLQSSILSAKNAVCLRHKIPFTHQILLFNGDLGYYPNEEAVTIIIQKINPLLLKQTDFLYTILICGKNLAETYVDRIYKEANLIYPGYVDDISEYVLAADIFINPVISGGGIKTKLVEALGYNCNAVSVVSGATGITVEKTNNKLIVVKDYDWQGFADAVIKSDINLNTPAVFYNHFYWGNIAEKALHILKRI